MQTTRSRHVRRSSNASRGGRPTHGRTSNGGSRVHSSHAPRRQGNRGGGRKMPTFNPSQFINTNPVSEVVEVYTPKHTFGDFGFDQKIVQTLDSLSLSIPSPIQDKIIPEIIAGNDVVGIAETGTGKTAAFLLPLMQKTLHERGRQTLVLTPTRELAIQIEQELRKLSAGLGIFSTVCVGGINIRPQINSLRRKNHFIIGTPGRVLDLLARKCLNTGRFTTVVLDEADRMLDMGFIDPIRKILGAMPAERETLLFSATMDTRARGLVGEFLKNPTMVTVKKKDVTDSIKQDVVRHKAQDKFQTLARLLANDTCRRVIVFGAMKHSVEKLSQELNTAGISADAIHGNKNHTQRQRALANFKNGRVKVLVATDVAARGIHVDDVSHVINYDMPNTFEDYVHRIGRTGRGNKKGEALTFVPHE